MELFLSKWKDWMPKHMPVATSRTMVKTGPSSSLLMAVYASSQVAENAREVVEVFFDLFYMDIKRSMIRCFG